MIKLADLELSAIRSRGKGGQNVNKVSTGIHLRFDINASSLSAKDKEKLLKLSDTRLSKEGTIVIKADQFRTQEKNRLDAIQRLNKLVEGALKQVKVRKKTALSKTKITKRLDAKSQRGSLKQTRKKVRF